MLAFVVVFVLGLCVGSFLNVVIYRLPMGDNIVWPGSRCPNCFWPIHSYQNIPVLSWLALGGRCAHCRYPISARYPVVELLCGVLLVVLKLLTPDFVQFVYLAAFVCILIALAFIDFDFFILPDALTYLLAALGLLGQFIFAAKPWLNFAVDALIGPMILLAIRQIYWLWRRQEGLGLGDVKLMVGIGAVLGSEGAIFSLVVGSALGSIVGILLLARGTAGMRTALPFGPFLIIAALTWLFLALAGWLSLLPLVGVL